MEFTQDNGTTLRRSMFWDGGPTFRLCSASHRGAGSLWQWRLHAVEPDHAAWCTAPGAGWREALGFEGSRYPECPTLIFDVLPFLGRQPNWTCTHGRCGLVVAGRLFVLYLPEGGGTGITSLEVPRAYRIFEPHTVGPRSARDAFQRLRPPNSR